MEKPIGKQASHILSETVYLDVIRNINSHSEIHYVNNKLTGSGHLEFLKKCNSSLYEFFIKVFKENLVYSTIAYKSNLHKTFEIVPGSDNLTGYNFQEDVSDGFRESLRVLLDESQNIKDKIIINLTNILLNDVSGFDLFFVDNKNDYKEIISKDKIPASHINTFPLGELIFADDIVTFESTNKSKILDFQKLLNSQEFTSFHQYSRYLWHYKKLAKESKKKKEDKFYVHFIRPSIVEFNYNVLLALATKIKLSEYELSFIDLLIYRIIGQTAVEKNREYQELKRKTSFSLTTHSIKTQLETTVIKLSNNFKDNLKTKCPELLNKYDLLNDELKELFDLTSLLSIIDKIDNKEKFIETGLKSKLLVKSPELFGIKKLNDFVAHFNERYSNTAKINVVCTKTDLNLEIPVHNLFLGEKLIKLLINTILENLIKYGKRQNGQVNLIIKQDKNKLCFINNTIDKQSPIDESKLKGNLKLFKELIEGTNSGEFLINTADYKFIIDINSNSNE